VARFIDEFSLRQDSEQLFGESIVGQAKRSLVLMKEFALCDKVVLITGAATGIGRATAVLLAEAGAAVVATGLDGDEGFALQAEQRALERKLYFREVDVTQSDQVLKTVEFAESEFGRLDGIVNGAAVHTPGKRLEELSDAEWDATLNTNVGGMFRVCRAGLPALRRAGGGSIVNISSVHAIATATGLPDYAASKGAVLSLSRQLALDYAVDRIRVNALIVGSVDTRMSRPALDAVGGPEALGLSFDPRAIPRIGRPEEVAAVIAFLISDASSYITGSGLVADGGMLAKLM
jgi:NAD(P)-dependent dehydrogenase (short-subunit alcohol dehydrogenase family)